MRAARRAPVCPAGSPTPAGNQRCRLHAVESRTPDASTWFLKGRHVWLPAFNRRATVWRSVACRNSDGRILRHSLATLGTHSKTSSSQKTTGRQGCDGRSLMRTKEQPKFSRGQVWLQTKQPHNQQNLFLPFSFLETRTLKQNANPESSIACTAASRQCLCSMSRSRLFVFFFFEYAGELCIIVLNNEKT